RGIPVIELDDDQIVMPGMVNPYSRYGMSGSGFNDSRPQVMASAELYPSTVYDAFLENGVTTVAQYPAGQGIPGQAVALRPMGETAAEMIVEDGVYVKAVMRNSSSAKRNLTDGFKKADAYLKKVESEREKFEKKNKDDKKKGSKDFVPPKPDANVQAFLDLREGKLQMLFSIRDAAGWAHLLHAIGDEEFQWHLRVPLTRDINVFHVKDEIGEKGCYTIMEPLITLMPGTMRQRNLPAEFDRAGAKLVLIPRSDSPDGFEQFLEDVGTMISAGLDRKSAVRAVTMHPAGFLGLGDRVGTLAEGKRANLVVFSGDPFQPGTKIDGVMLDGRFVTGDIDQ
ncbi:MAG: amidohydrolase family protein, partial [Planctomycetota bacterium]|nr:amidohydrolase family protein [Planctomycetota bacterium]